MGYDVHITRKENWFDKEPQITLAEWKAFLEADPSMQLDGHAQTSMPDGETLRYENEGLAVWTAYSRHEPDGNKAWFDFQRGDVVVKNPDEEMLRKMWHVAQALGAKVQGEDGETYREDGTPDQPEPETPPPPKPGILSRIASWFGRRRSAESLQEDAPAFRAGQRVKNPWGDLGTVVSVNRKAEHGMGIVRVRMDDGSEHKFAYVASSLEIVDDQSSGG